MCQQIFYALLTSVPRNTKSPSAKHHISRYRYGKKL